MAVHSLSKRSNLAGYRAAFLAGDPAVLGAAAPDPQARRHDDLRADPGRGGRRPRRRRRTSATSASATRPAATACATPCWPTASASSTARPASTSGPRGTSPAGTRSPTWPTSASWWRRATSTAEAGDKFVRVALTATDERVQAAVNRLAPWGRGLRDQPRRTGTATGHVSGRGVRTATRPAPAHRASRLRMPARRASRAAAPEAAAARGSPPLAGIGRQPTTGGPRGVTEHVTRAPGGSPAVFCAAGVVVLTALPPVLPAVGTAFLTALLPASPASPVAFCAAPSTWCRALSSAVSPPRSGVGGQFGRARRSRPHRPRLPPPLRRAARPGDPAGQGEGHDAPSTERTVETGVVPSARTHVTTARSRAKVADVQRKELVMRRIIGCGEKRAKNVR